MKDPLVSIVTPTYNQGQFIEDTILSVKTQDYPHVEHIVMDGGSTDETIDVLKKHENDYRMEWFSGEDDGPPDACNRGFRRASGDIYAYINSDDLYLPGAVREAVKAFVENPESDVIYGNTLRIDQHGRVTEKNYSTPLLPSWEALLLAHSGFVIQQPAAFWRREAFEAVGGFNPSSLAKWDFEYWIDLAVQGATFTWMDRFWACFRSHPESISDSDRLEEIAREVNERAFKKAMGREKSKVDRYLLQQFSRLVAFFVPPRNVFRKFGLPSSRIDPGKNPWVED